MGGKVKEERREREKVREGRKQSGGEREEGYGEKGGVRSNDGPGSIMTHLYFLVIVCKAVPL